MLQYICIASNPFCQQCQSADPKYTCEFNDSI